MLKMCHFIFNVARLLWRPAYQAPFTPQTPFCSGAFSTLGRHWVEILTLARIKTDLTNSSGGT